MKKLISFSVHHPLSVIMLTLALVMCGILCIFSINTDFLPVLSSRHLIICTKYQGITPSEIEEMITIPEEEAFSSLKGLKKMESVSRDSLSIISIELKWGTDIDLALVQCREIIDSCYPSLPSGCEKPEVFEKNTQKDTVKIAVIPLDEDLNNAEILCRTEIKPILQRLTGVSSVKITGGKKEQIEVLVDKDEADARNLTLQEISDIIAYSNFEYPAGTITEGENDLSIKTDGLYKNIKEILQTPLLYNNGGILDLASIAKVKRAHKKQDSFFMLNGKECIQLSVQKQNDASPVKVSKAVKSELKELEQSFSSYLKFQIIEDRSEELKNSLFQLCISALCSFFITSAVVFFFLNSLRLSLLLSFIIPLTALFSIIILYITGNTLNIMSLSGIAIGIGMVIDCSAVAIENIQEKKIKNQNEKEDQIIKAVNEISSSNIASSLTTILVFLPVFFMEGLTGELFSSMATAISAAIASSCLFSFTLVPAIFTVISKNNIPLTKDKQIFKTAEIQYQKQLSLFFKKKHLLVFICLICLAAGFFTLKTRRFSLLPELTANAVEAEIAFPSDSSISMLKIEAQNLYEKLSELQQIKSISISGGIENDDFSHLCRADKTREQLTVSVIFNKPEKTSIQAFKKLLLESFPDAAVYSSNSLLSQILTTGPKRFLLTAQNRENCNYETNKICAQNAGCSVIPDSYITEHVFTPDRISSSRFSITAVYTASIIRNAIEGVESCNYYENGKAIPIIVKFQDGQIDNIDNLEMLKVKLENQSIPMHVLGKFSTRKQESILYRYNKKYAKLIQTGKGNFPAKNLTDLQKIQAEELWGGSSVLLCVVFLLLYLVLGAQFESFIIPLLLLLTLPPALSGAFIFLTATGKNLDINSVIAMVVLFGTVVNNSIILYERCRAENEIFSQSSIIDACSSKLKTLLLTNGTTICSLIPFAFDPKNTSSQASVAITIIGGMIFSLVISIFVIPVLLKPLLCVKRTDK